MKKCIASGTLIQLGGYEHIMTLGIIIVPEIGRLAQPEGEKTSPHH